MEILSGCISTGMKLVKGKNNYFIMLTAFWLLAITAVCITTAYTMRYDRPKWRSVKAVMSWHPALRCPPRNYAHISLTGNEITDAIKLDMARTGMRRILMEMDTIHGIHFHFGDSARYKTLIRVMDMLRQEKAQHYLQDSDGIRFLYVSGE